MGNFGHRSILAVFIGAEWKGLSTASLSFRRGNTTENFRLFIVAVAALDQHKGHKGPSLTGTISLL